MTKEEAIKFLQQLYPNGGHCWLDEQRIEAIGMAVKALQEEPVAPKVLEDMLNAKTATESLGISQEAYDMIVDELIYGKEPELVDVDDLPNKEEEPVSENRKEAILKKAHELANRAELISDKFPKSKLIAVAIDMAEWCDSHSIEEPVSEDLEKIVEEIAEPTILNAYGTKELARRLRNTICGTSVSEDLEEAAMMHFKDVMERKAKTGLETANMTSFKAGAKWQKQQMMKDAVPATVLTNQYGNKYIRSWSGLIEYNKFKNGDEVKVYLIKEDRDIIKEKVKV